MKAKELIEILGKDPEATVWIENGFFDQVGTVEHKRITDSYGYFLLRGKLKELLKPKQ